MEVLDQPVVYVIRDVHLGEFIKQCWVSDSVEGFAKVQVNDDNKLVGGEEVGDGVKMVIRAAVVEPDERKAD